ncbi:MAG: sporulation protein YtxC [Alkaliphilus sp.]
MNLLSILVDGDAEKLKLSINGHIGFLKKKEIFVEQSIEKGEQQSLLHFGIKKESLDFKIYSGSIKAFKYQIALALLEHIEKKEQTKIIKEIVQQECYYFSKKEKDEIEKTAIGFLGNNKKSFEDIMSFKKLEKTRAVLIDSILQSLNRENCFNIRGFIDFRLKDYCLVLVEVVEKAIEEYLMKREFNDFIKLLRYFVDVQEPKVKIVHIALDEEDKFRLYDNQNKLINDENLRDIAVEISGKYIGYDDLLVSSLITIAPEKIYIHHIAQMKKREVYKTISKVFASKVEICSGCKWCVAYVNKNE